MPKKPRPIKFNIDDQSFEEIERLANAAIHELVFAIQHTEQDEPVEAGHCLDQVVLNVDSISDLLAEARLAINTQQPTDSAKP